MKRNFTCLLLALILAFSLVGCGGGSGNNNSSHIQGSVLSSDYFGLEIGFESIASGVYKNLITGTTLSGTATILVIGEVSPGSGIYKVAEGAVSEDGIQSVPLGTVGTYYQKIGASYYNYGYWDKTGNTYEELPDLILTNPVIKGFYSPDYETTVTGQEKVTVSAGTFTAWIFECRDHYDEYSEDGYEYGAGIEIYKGWFVPYLGFVKSMKTYVRDSDNKTVYTGVAQLTSSKKGVTFSGSVNPAQLNTTSAEIEYFCKKIFLP